MDRFQGMSEQDLDQNLRDAGCDLATTDAVSRCFQAGTFSQGIRHLRRFRMSLLSDLHTAQKKIDCLDYLLSQFTQYLRETERIRK